MRMSRLIAVLPSLLLICSVCFAQAQGDSVSTPIPGAGHDYIHMLDETVNPANGSLSIRIQLPIPKSRGITLPFAFTYDSNRSYSLMSNTAAWNWIPSPDNFGLGGWSFSVPELSYTPGMQSDTNSDGSTNSCLTASDFMFRDPNGAPHQLGMYLTSTIQYGNHDPGADQDPPLCLGIVGGSIGGDSQVLSEPPFCAFGCDIESKDAGPITVLDSDDNRYVFTDWPEYAKTPINYEWENEGYGTNILPAYVEDRNGNELTFSSNTTSAPYTFAYTDSSGRQVIQAPYLGVIGTPGAEVYVSGSANPYVITYETAPASYSVPYVKVQPWEGCAVISRVSGSQLVIKSIQLPNGRSYQFGYDPTYGLLDSITYPDGGTVTYTWQMSSSPLQLASQGCSGGNIYNPYSIQQYSTPVITSRVVQPSGGTVQAQSFTYETPTWTSIPNYDVGSAWSQRVTKVVTTDNVLNKSFETDYTYGSIAQNAPWWDQWFISTQIPVETSIQYFDWNGSLLKTVTKGWDDQFRLDCDLETLPNGLTSGHFYTYYGMGLKVSDEKDFDYGQITGPAPSACYNLATAPSGRTPLRETISDFQETRNLGLTPPFLLDTLSSVVTNNSGGNRAAETDYAYDETPVSSVPSPSTLTNHDEQNYSSSSTIPRGNPTTITKQCFPNCTNAVTHYTYDETGQILTAVDADQHPATQYSYADCYESGTGTPPGPTNAFLTQVIDSMGHKSSFCYGYADGRLRSSADPNSETTQYKYNDPLARLTEMDSPDGGQTVLTYNDFSPSVTTQKLMNSGGQDLTEQTLLDGMGRITENETTDPEGTDYKKTTYDGEGRPYQVWNPYRTTNDSTYGVTTYSYDALGRPTEILNPDNSSVQTLYTGRATEVTDEGNGTRPVSRISQSDALGRLLSVCEVTSSSLTAGTDTSPSSCGQDIAGTGFLTTYQYDVLGNLLQVNQGGLSQRNYAYDSLSRLTCSATPEIFPSNCASSPAGAITYAYDPNSNLTSKTAPLPNQTNESSTVTTNYAYDNDNRLLQKSYTDGITPIASYQYDACPSAGCPNSISPANPIGRMVEAANTNGQEWNSYDPVGRVTGQWQCTPENCGSSYFALPYSYDLLGNMTSSSNGLPGSNNVQLTYTYDDAAHLTHLSSSLEDANHPGTVFAGQQHTPSGLLADAFLGNGVTQSFNYTNREWLQSAAVGNPSGSGSTKSSGSSSVSGSEQSVVVNPGVSGTGTVTITGSEQEYQYDPCNVEYEIGDDDWMYCEAQEDYQGNAWAIDYGEVTITVGTFTADCGYSSWHDTPTTIASCLASQIDDSDAPVSASASNGVVTLTALSPGVSTDYAFSTSSWTDNTTLFSNPSFYSYQSGPALTGGADPVYLFDTGVVWINVVTPDGTWLPCSALYGSSDTPSTVAAKMASNFNLCNSTFGFPLTASYSGSGTTINLSSSATGLQTNYYSINTTAESYNPQYFPEPSFTMSVPDLSGGTSAPLYTFSLGFAPDGDVTSANDSVNGTWSYAYDDFNRLIGGTQTGQPSYTYAYDLYGNRWNDLFNGQCSAGTASCLTFDQNNHINGQCTAPNNPASCTTTPPVAYDAAGNVISDSAHSHYYYDAENRLIQVDSALGNCATATACYVYDANGQRIRKTAFGASVDYVYDLDGHQVAEVSSSGAWNRGEVYAGGHHIATYVTGANPTTIFDHSDWLGTERVRTNMSMQPCESETSLPFGDGLSTVGSCGDPSPMHFTGKQHDMESSLDDFGARYYSAAPGRFTSPDWSARPQAVPYSNLSDPQTFNSYAYAGNNPLTRRDIDGHWSPWQHVDITEKAYDRAGITRNQSVITAVRDVDAGGHNPYLFFLHPFAFNRAQNAPSSQADHFLREDGQSQASAYQAGIARLDGYANAARDALLAGDQKAFAAAMGGAGHLIEDSFAHTDRLWGNGGIESIQCYVCVGMADDHDHPDYMAEYGGLSPQAEGAVDAEADFLTLINQSAKTSKGQFDQGLQSFKSQWFTWLPEK